MIGAEDLFMIFTVSNSGMHKELGRRIRNVVQGFGAVVF
jgi:hypothetical protein